MTNLFCHLWVENVKWKPCSWQLFCATLVTERIGPTTTSLTTNAQIYNRFFCNFGLNCVAVSKCNVYTNIIRFHSRGHATR